MGKSGCCTFCGIFSFIGALFFGASSLMVMRQNKVFLSHKAGMDLTDLNQEELDTKFWAIIYAAIVRKSPSLFVVSFFNNFLFLKAEIGQPASIHTSAMSKLNRLSICPLGLVISCCCLFYIFNFTL